MMLRLNSLLFILAIGALIMASISNSSSLELVECVLCFRFGLPGGVNVVLTRVLFDTYRKIVNIHRKLIHRKLKLPLKSCCWQWVAVLAAFDLS